MILVTGGAGFIGANFVLDWLAHHDEPVINVDKLTYAGNLENLASLQGDVRHIFVQADIGDSAVIGQLLAQHQPRAVVNFAAESHVDRSIHGPEDFIQTNVVGTFRLLEAVLCPAQSPDDSHQAPLQAQLPPQATLTRIEYLLFFFFSHHRSFSFLSVKHYCHSIVRPAI